MARSSRLTTVLMLLVAILVTGVLPAVGSWSCPDGTACVYTQGVGFHCVGSECQMACCEAGRQQSTGCGRCNHGGAPGAAAASHPGRTLMGADHCRYHEAAQLDAVWAPSSVAFDLQVHPVALVSTPVVAPMAAGLWETLAPIRGSPPPSHLSPSSAPRAPPGPDCA
jgi:hypothetical protein